MQPFISFADIFIPYKVLKLSMCLKNILFAHAGRKVANFLKVDILSNNIVE